MPLFLPFSTHIGYRGTAIGVVCRIRFPLNLTGRVWVFSSICARPAIFDRWFGERLGPTPCCWQCILGASAWSVHKAPHRCNRFFFRRLCLSVVKDLPSTQFSLHLLRGCESRRWCQSMLRLHRRVEARSSRRSLCLEAVSVLYTWWSLIFCWCFRAAGARGVAGRMATQRSSAKGVLTLSQRVAYVPSATAFKRCGRSVRHRTIYFRKGFVCRCRPLPTNKHPPIFYEMRHNIIILLRGVRKLAGCTWHN